MTITERQEGPILVLSPEGRLDHAGAGVFQKHAVSRIEEGVRSMVVDFHGTSFLASMGFRALMIPAQEMSRAGGRFALAGLSPELARLFETAGLYQLFKVYPSISDAANDGAWA